MKKEDVKRGMKVVPVRKPKYGVEWGKAKKNGQPYLFVVGWREFARAWSLSYEKNSLVGDWFKSGDFKPYRGE